MYNKLKNKLKQFPAIVRVKKYLWRSLRIAQARHENVNEKSLSKYYSSHKNFKSLTFESGLVAGSFKDTPYFIKIRPENYIESHIFLDGLWEPHIVELISGYLRGSKHSLIDIGSNIGATSIPLAKHFYNTKFYLFEPHPHVYNTLINNVSYNKLHNVVAKNVAITDSNTEPKPFYAQKNANNFGLSSFTLNHDIDEFDVIYVDCQTLDSVFLNTNEKIGVIKIDTQGHELNVLLSATNIIENDRPIIIFEFESEYFETESLESRARQNVIKFFSKMRYELYMIDPSSKFMPKITLDTYYQGDILAVPLS